MRITDLLDKRSISLNAAPADKKETLDLAVELMAKSGKLSDVEKYRAQVYAREEESTTGIGEGIAIPHGKCDAVKAPGLAAMVIKNGVEYESLDGEPVNLTPLEYSILKLLMESPGKVFSSDEIYQAVWNGTPYGANATVAVHIRHLREKLEIDPANPRYLKVLWGHGYKMEADH